MKQLQRLELLVGLDTIRKIENKTVLILGLGGVGGYALEALARSGIGKIILVDADTIDITNLNRQILALRSNIGEYKVDVAEKRILEINDSCEIKKINQFILPDNISQLFEEPLDYIIDCCDTIETKKELIRKCVKYQIKLISCMGTGNKFDPTKLELTELKKTTYDPIAKLLRKMVKEEEIKESIMVVSSTETPQEVQGRTIGSTSYVPATAGLLCASYVINDIIEENQK